MSGREFQYRAHTAANLTFDGICPGMQSTGALAYGKGRTRIQQARSRPDDTGADALARLRVAKRHVTRCLALVARVNGPDFVSSFVERVESIVELYTWQPENRIDLARQCSDNRLAARHFLRHVIPPFLFAV